MGRTVFLHVGAPKTGTTYLQDRLTRNARSLARHGVHVPSTSPLVSPALAHFRAALDLLGQDWGGATGHARGSWDALARRVRRRAGTVVISHEILAPAPPEAVARAVADLGGGPRGDTEVHVVYTVRDLGRQLPAAWQESIKQGRRWSFRRFLTRVQRSRTWFHRAFDLPAVLTTWGADLPPEHMHVVTVPPPGAAHDLLWHRFCSVVGVDPVWALRDSQRRNVSLGAAETQVVRKLNRRMDRRTRREAPYDELIRDMLAQQELVHGASESVVLPPRLHAWVEAATDQWVDWLEGSGVDVVGDLADLRPVWPTEAEAWLDPDRVAPRQQLRVALDALAAMTREAASRPDPARELPGRVRGAVRRMRER